MKALTGCIGMVVLGISALFIGTLLKAFIIAQIWGWYMVPLFGVAPITMVLAFGLACIVQLLTLNSAGLSADRVAENKDADTYNHVILSALTIVFATLFIWGMAAIGTLWLPDSTDNVSNHIDIVGQTERMVLEFK